MEDKSKVSVKIYGQEYKISANAPKEYIQQVTNYVDSKITEVASKMKQYTTPMLTVLAAVNIADELFKAKQKILEVKAEIERMSLEIKHKNNILDEVKSNYLRYKEDAEKATQQMQAIEKELFERNEQYKALVSETEAFRTHNDMINKENETLKQLVHKLEADLQTKEAEIEHLKQTNQELENIYFDTEMINVQLKKELEDMTKSA